MNRECLSEIEQLEQALRNIEEEEQRDQQQEAVDFAAKFENWCQKKESQEKMNKMIAKMMNQGVGTE